MFHHLQLKVSEGISGKTEQQWSLERVLMERSAPGEGRQRNSPGYKNEKVEWKQRYRKVFRFMKKEKKKKKKIKLGL